MIIKILLAAILALGVGNVGQFLWGKWQARSYQKQIMELQEKNLRQEMIIKAQAANLADAEAEAKAKRKVIYVREKIDEAVDAGDDVALRRHFIDRGMLPKDEVSNPSGAKSDTRH